MKNKLTKVFIISLCLVLVASVIGVGAYLMDSEAADNAFTIGANEIRLIENFIPPKELKPGIEFEKLVRVQNTGSTTSWIRVMAVFTNSDMGDWCTIDWNDTDWVYDETDGYWYHKNPVEPNGYTANLFTKVKLSDDIPEVIIKDFDIIVYAESYSTGGVSDYESAWTKYQKNRSDSIGPGVFVSNPTSSDVNNATYVNTNVVKVTGIVTDSSGVATLTINGNAVSFDSATGAYSYDLAINGTGVNEITVVATDTVGNKTTVTKYVRYDDVAPELTVLTPVDDVYVYVATNSIVVAGSVSDADSGVKSVSVNGNAATVDANGDWTITLVLTKDAMTDFNIVAMDNAGNSVTEIRSVCYDVTAPVLELAMSLSEDVGAPTVLNATTISGVVSDNLSGMSSFIINGDSVAIADDGSWSYDLGLSDGDTITLVIVLQDAAGNEMTVTKYVSYVATNAEVLNG